MSNVEKLSFYFVLIFSLCFYFGNVISMQQPGNLKEKLESLLTEAENGKNITQDIINLDLNADKFYGSHYGSRIFQFKINFTESYNLVNPRGTDSAVNLKKLYDNTLRYNKYNYTNKQGKFKSSIENGQDVLNFIFHKNKENINFARTMEIAMLGSYFLRHIDSNIDTKIFPFVISSKMLFHSLQDQDKDRFLKSFGTIGAGEQAITINREHDIPLNDKDGIYSYQQRVIDYLEELKNSQKYNQNLVLLTGLYFLKLYFTGAAELPEDNLGRFEGEGKFIETKDEAYFKLLETKESKEINEEVKVWSKEFGDFTKAQRKIQEENKIKKEKERLEQERKAKNKRYLIYGGITILGIGSVIAALIYKNWDYWKNRFGK